MQDHYLDLMDPCSKWGEEFNFSIKGDVCPDNMIFDLDQIELLFEEKNLSTLYADRGRPMRFSIANRMFIAPNGGNFILRTSLLAPLKKRFLRLSRTCDNSYNWSLFMEYYWGELFFEEGSRSFDYVAHKIIEGYKGNDILFKIGPEDYYSLRNRYISSQFYPNDHRMGMKIVYIIKRVLCVFCNKF